MKRTFFFIFILLLCLAVAIPFWMQQLGIGWPLT